MGMNHAMINLIELLRRCPCEVCKKEVEDILEEERKRLDELRVFKEEDEQRDH